MRAPVGVKEEHAAICPSSSAGGLDNGGAAPAVQAALKKGPWTPAEDAILLDYVRKNGEGNWNAVQKNSGLQRCGKSCRLRWANHLRPNLKKGSFSPEEEALILQLHARLGNKWARMAAQLPGRTDNEIKNYWNTRIKRRQRAGLPLYPAEIQRQITLKNQKQGIAMSPACTAQHSLLDSTTFSPPAVALPLLHQNQISSFLQDPTQLKNFLDSSCSFHPPLTVSPSAATLFPNAAALHAVRDIELSPPLVAQSPAYPEKMELPSTQLFATTGGGIQLPPLSMGQGNCGLLDALLQETQGVGELFKDGLLFEPLPPPTSKSSFMDPLCKLSYSPCSDEILLREEAVQKPVAGIPALLDNTPAQATEVPAETVIHDSCNGDGCELSNGQSSEVTSDDLSLEMQQLASTLAMAHDWSFGSCSWDNMPLLTRSSF